MPEPTVKLSDDEVQFFHENGYLSIDAITTQEEVQFLREVYDRLFDAQAGREAGDQFDLGGTDEEGDTAVLPQMLNPVKYAPELENTQFRVNALAIAKQLLGEDARGTGEHAILKPANYGAPTPWHQDEAYWNPAQEYNSLSVWMPLQQATVENGCMQFIPGSHKLEVLPHHSIGNDPRVHGLEADDVPEVDEARAVACPLPPGGATFHASRTLHYAGPNKSDKPRRAYILGFGVPAKERDEPRRFPWQEEKQTARQQRAEKTGVAQSEPGVEGGKSE